MKRKVARLRLSPNEEAQLLREEHERRRKLRIQQVREQERYIALQIRREVQRRRQREIENLAEELKEDWQRQQREKLDTLQTLYEDSLRLLGEGHRSAKENEPDLEAMAQKHEENHDRAALRYHSALKELKSQRQKEQQEQNRFIQTRKKAIQVEKARAAKVASLPPPPPNPIENIQAKKLPMVKKSDVDAFSVTRYHMPETAVDREADTTRPSAQQTAAEEERRLQDLAKDEAAERQEQLETARLRGNHALRMEQLTQDRQRLLVELEHMQQTELLRRRHVVTQMPAQIFQPLYKRQEMREDQQRDMELAFEDMYTGERRVKGDLVLQLVPEPLPALSTGSQDQDQELDLTLDEVPPGDQQGHDDDRGQQQDPAVTRVEAPMPPEGAPRRALKRLLNRIRTQRDQWSSQGDRDPQTNRQTTEAADRDTTIDTGSLTSEEERGRPPTASPALPEASQTPPPKYSALETTEESVVAGTLLHPDEQACRIHTFQAERKRREEELERQKQEQLTLLQELEEQKAKLEQLLQEAQQERQQLQTAVDQQDTAAGTIQEVPVQDQEVTSVTPPPAAEPTASAGEDQHTCRIREYQQRLLEQNRLHKQSVEEARRRLEDYQCTLRNRYNSTTTATLAPPRTTNTILLPPSFTFRPIPPAVPIQLPFGSAVPLRLPVALSINSRTQAPMEMPTRDSAILTQPPIFPGPGVHTRATSGIDSRTWSVQLEATAEISRHRRPYDSAWLADGVMERVSAHLPEGLRPPSTTADPLSYGPPSSLDALVPPGTDPLPAPSSMAQSEHPAPPPEEASAEPGTILPGLPQAGQPCAEEMERRRRGLREAQRRVRGQREALLLQQKELEEELREQRRRQKEALQALLSADTQQPDLEDHDDGVTGPEGVATDRLSLMSALLRVIEESSGHLLPSVEASQDGDSPPALRPLTSQDGDGPPALRPLTSDAACESDLPESPAPLAQNHAHPRAPKPPMARARLGVMETIMTERHELSAIEEVDTPVDASLVTAPEECTAPYDSAWLADGVMERLTAHLLEGLRRPSTTADPLSPSSLDALDPPGTDPLPAPISMAQSEHLAPPPEEASAKPGTVLPALPQAGQPCAEEMERRRRGLREAQRRVRYQREAPQLKVKGRVVSRLICNSTPYVVVSSAPGEGARASPPRRGAPLDWAPPAPPDRGPPGSTASSRGEPSAGRGSSSGTGSGRSSRLSWRERLRLEAGASPEHSPGAPALPEQPSCNSSDSGRGGISFKSPTELETVSLRSAHRPSEPDSLSSTTISSGSYTTTDPEHSSNQTDALPLSARFRVATGGGGRGRAWLNGSSSSSGRSSCEEGASAPAPPASEAPEHDSSIQRIIDKYTRELTTSLSMAGKTTATERAVMDDPDSSLSLQPWSEEEQGSRTTDPPSPPSDRGPQPARRDQEWDDAVSKIIEHLSDRSSSLAHSQGRHSTLDQMIGRLLDQSSLAGADQGRDSDMHRLIGHPSAQSSSLGGDLEVDSAASRTIGPLSDQMTPAGADRGWDSTLTRMIGRLSSQSASQWPSGAPEADAGWWIGRTGPSAWLDEGQSESRMRPLAAEPDESATQRSGSSGGDGSSQQAWEDQGGSGQAWEDQGGSGQASVSSGPARAPEGRPESSSPPGLEPHYRRLQPSGSPQEPYTSGVDPASDSFHPLLAEVTHNETAEPSMTFHLPEEEEHSSPDGSSHSSPVEELSLTAHSEEEPPGGDLGQREDLSESSDASPERLRTEGPSHSLSALQDSLYQLTTSQCHPHDSALVVSPTAEEAGLAALSLSGLRLSERAPALDLPQGGDVPEKAGWAFAVDNHGRTEAHQLLFSHSKASPPIWEKIMEAGSEKGILEESQLTLVSLTDSTLQDQELTITEEGECKDQELTINEEEEGEFKGKEEEIMRKEFETTLSEEDTTLKKGTSPSHAVMLLEFQSCPSTSLQEAFQQKRRALIQRSARRVEEIKATRAEARDQSISWTSTRTQSTTAQPKREPKTAELGSTGGDGKPKKSHTKPQPPSPGTEARLKKVGEVRICTPEQRKEDVAEMHQRTERLYSQLEEVKHLKEIRSRQELYAKNREKAKEFHKKTLQKLRAKKTPQ